jgi:translation initiation factor IF-3
MVFCVPSFPVNPNPEFLIANRPHNRNQRFNREPEIRHNKFIRAREVRLIGPDGNQIGVLDTRDAMRKAMDYGLDLVEISPNAVPPVCRIMDYGKHKFELDRKKKEAKKKQSVVKVKEVKFHANVEEHDYQTKMRHLRDFISDNNRVKCTLWFRGRENTHTELGVQLFERIIEESKDIAFAEQPPKLAGKNLSMLLSPGKKKN